MSSKHGKKYNPVVNSQTLYNSQFNYKMHYKYKSDKIYSQFLFSKLFKDFKSKNKNIFKNNFDNAKRYKKLDEIKEC